MTAAELAPPGLSARAKADAGLMDRVVEPLRVLVVAGIATGVVVAGVGSRLAMFLLRLTSPDRVIGVTSDDGFIIGRFTLSGTYNLLHLGAVVGVIGAGAYWLVAPWLIGPNWFRRLTVAAGSGAVVGSMLVHADGIDFTLLEPTWLAIGLFVALPAVFGAVLAVTVDRVARPGSWTSRGRIRPALPLVAVALFPISAFPTVLVAVMLGFASFVTDLDYTRVGPRWRMAGGLTVRAIWLALAGAGLMGLVGDIRAIV